MAGFGIWMLYTLCLWVARAGEQKRPGPEAHTRPTDVGCWDHWVGSGLQAEGVEGLGFRALGLKELGFRLRDLRCSL